MLARGATTNTKQQGGRPANESFASRVRASKSFFAALIVSLIVSTVLVIVGLNLVGLGSPTSADHDELGNWLGVASLTLGVAATLAVAWATVQLGNSALRVSNDSHELARAQGNREDSEFADDRVRQMLNAFGRLSFSLGDLLAVAGPIDGFLAPCIKTPENDDVRLPYAGKAELQSQHALAIEPFVNKIGELRHVLYDLTIDPYANHIATRFARQNADGCVTALQRLLPDEPSIQRLSPFDLGELRRCLLLVESDPTTREYRTFVRPHWVSCEMQVPGNFDVARLAFVGTVICSQVVSVDGRPAIVSVGTAMLVDLVRLLPTELEAIDEFCALYTVDRAIVQRFLAGAGDGDHVTSVGRQLRDGVELLCAEPHRLLIPLEP